MNAKSARNSNLKIQNLNSQINIEWILNLFRCPSKSKSHATCILKMEYQSAEQRRKFASEFSEVVVQSSTAIFGLAFAGTTNEPANTGRTSCSGYPSSVASSQQGLYSYLPALGFFFHWIIQLNLFQSCHYILRKQFDIIYENISSFENLTLGDWSIFTFSSSFTLSSLSNLFLICSDTTQMQRLLYN